MNVYEKLYYQEDKQWEPFGSWARFFVQLGILVAEHGTTTKDSRLVVAVAAPTRAFAAALVTFGTVAARSRTVGTIEGRQAHFDMLCRLPVGTPLLFRDRTRVKTAVFDGMQLISDKPHVVVRTENDRGSRTRDMVNLDRCFTVSVADMTEVRLPANQRGRHLATRDEFLSAFVPRHQVMDFVLGSRSEAAIIGVRSQLEEEMKVPIGVKVGARVTPGSIYDLLRPRGGVGRTQGYRTELHSTDRTPEIGVGPMPFLTVFDGSRGFLKFRHIWNASHRLVVLDRTDPTFLDATIAYNGDYRGRDEELDLPGLDLPDGVELSAYKEAMPR